MNICAVTVTYGNRFRLLSRVIDALVREKVTKIVIVDNASDEESRKQLSDKVDSLKHLLIVKRLFENTGSAAGFRTGIETANALYETEFIWLLDDDNVPEEGALKELVELWNKYEILDKENRLCLLSNRKSRPEYKIMASYDTCSMDEVLGRRNSFLGFNILNGFYPRRGIVKFNSGIRENNIFMQKQYGHLPVAPYGGMFFHKRLLEIIGLPDERFYLYCDDYEFSHRIIRNNGEIIFVPQSKIIDIDDYSSDEPSIQDNEWDRLYYSTRNLIYLQKEFSDSKLLFRINAILFISFQKIKRVMLNMLGIEPIKKSTAFFNAIDDAISGNMGKRQK